MSSMTDEDLMDALLGLYAYDTGCVDSGIHIDCDEIKQIYESKWRTIDLKTPP